MDDDKTSGWKKRINVPFTVHCNMHYDKKVKFFASQKRIPKRNDENEVFWRILGTFSQSQTFI